jgi:hypothetical protein
MADIACSTNLAAPPRPLSTTTIASAIATRFAFDGFIFAELANTTSSGRTASIFPQALPNIVGITIGAITAAFTGICTTVSSPLYTTTYQYSLDVMVEGLVS